MMIESAIEIATGIFASGGFGALIGVAGGWLQKREARKQQQIDNEHELAMGKLSMDQMELENKLMLSIEDKKLDVAEVEGKLEVEKIEANAFMKSVKAQTLMTGIAIVDGIRFLMRPVITVFLLGATTLLYIDINERVGGIEQLPVNEIMDIYKHLIYQIVFLTLTAVSWWFMSRGNNKQITQK